MVDEFIAVDVETANQTRSSLCQIGIVAFKGTIPQWEWSSLIDPEEPFDEFNIGIHGIRSVDVQTAPTFPIVLESIADRIQGRIVASHTAFDCDALTMAAQKYGLQFPGCKWIDTCEIARFAWPTLVNHKLDTLCRHFGIELNHHDALADAAACGRILTRALLDTGIGLRELSTRRLRSSPQPRSSHSSRSRARYSERIELTGRPGGPLQGHVLVCTGDFTIGEAQLAATAANLGCDVEERVRKKRTTILVVGRRDPSQFNGKEKSQKQLDAETAIAEGRQITIMTEAEFLALAARYQKVTISA